MYIPASFKDENEKYITLPVLRKFCKEHNIKTTEIRDVLLDEIIEYAKKNDDYSNEVREWLENVLKQGIKHIYLRKIYSEENLLSILKDEKYCSKKLKNVFPNCPMKYISKCENEGNLKLQSYQYTTNKGKVNNISFYFTKLLLEGYNLNEKGNAVIFPIFVDIDLENSYIIARAKSKSQIYLYNDDKIIFTGSKTSTDRQIKEAIQYIKNKLNFVLEPEERSISAFRNVIYKILEDFTFTPEVIQKKIDRLSDTLDDYITELFKQLKIDETKNFENAKNDLNIFLEKYISINYPDKSIFTEDREAYPIKLSATDSEFTKVEETTSDREPLQCKAKFFDNKKSTKVEQTCDGLTLCYNRIDTTYYGTDPYLVKLVTSNGYCVIKFESYVEEDDIQNVLSRIINHREL